MISDKKPLISEPKVLVTGVEGAGKTLFAIQQADLLIQEAGDGLLYQVGIKEADPDKLPPLPFDLKDMQHNEDGSPVIDSNGSHLPMWASLPEGSVVIVDEAHKKFPQRGPGRPPPHIEMMAEGRQAGIRFIFVTQSPSSLDSFLRERIHRHFHLERKGNMNMATVFEFDRCVTFVRDDHRSRKEAPKHLWRLPWKKYQGWYTSAKSHHFKMRVPFKVIVALLMIPAVIFVGFLLIKSMKGVGAGTASMVSGASDALTAGAQHAPGRGGRGESRPVLTDPHAYLAQFNPVVPGLPWSAPVFQGQEVQTRPDLYCISVGQDGSEGCRCYTEQATPYQVEAAQCRTYARRGIYNPFRGNEQREARDSDLAERDKPEKPNSSASGVRAMTLIESPQSAAGTPAPQPAQSESGV